LDRPLSPLGAAFWSVALGVLDTACVEVTEAVRPGALTDIVNRGACHVLATSVVVFAMVRLHARDASLRQVLGFRPLAPLQAVLSIAAGAGLCPLLSTLNDLIVRRFPYPDDEALESMQKLLAASSRPALVVVAFVVIPVAQEIFFRGIVFGQLRRTVSDGASVLVTSTFFALSSLDVRSLPTMLVLGFALGRLRGRTGSVLAAVLGHIAFWSVEGLPILRGRDPIADVVYPTRWIVGSAAIAVLALVAVGAGKSRDA
jgi:membrane protease YdiL (CAAX protease family)